jgi:hypothetical protein
MRETTSQNATCPSTRSTFTGGGGLITTIRSQSTSADSPNQLPEAVTSPKIPAIHYQLKHFQMITLSNPDPGWRVGGNTPCRSHADGDPLPVTPH